MRIEIRPLVLPLTNNGVNPVPAHISTLRHLTEYSLLKYLYIKMLNINISGLDHVVFNVADAELSLDFYCARLGLEPLRVDEFRRGDVPFPSARINESTILDFFPPAYHRVTPGGTNVNHIALSVKNSADEMRAYLAANDIPIERTMTDNFAARGIARTAFHVMDPDRNMLELHTYAPVPWAPRRGREPLGEFLWLRRVIDKARAHRSGTIDEYIYPCPIDRGMMERWGVTPEEFDGAIAAHPDDRTMLTWACEHISRDRIDAANSWLCTEKIENLDRQDREEGVFS